MDLMMSCQLIHCAHMYLYLFFCFFCLFFTSGTCWGFCGVDFYEKHISASFFLLDEGHFKMCFFLFFINFHPIYSKYLPHLLLHLLFKMHLMYRFHCFTFVPDPDFPT